MIFLTTVMDEEETNTNNSVEHYDDHGCKPVLRLVPRPACMLMSISRSQRLLAFYNDQCPVVNSTGVLWVQLTPGSVTNVLASLARSGT